MWKLGSDRLLQSKMEASSIVLESIIVVFKKYFKINGTKPKFERTRASLLSIAIINTSNPVLLLTLKWMWILLLQIVVLIEHRPAAE